MIYKDGYILRFDDGLLAVFSNFNPGYGGSIRSETFYTIKDDDTLFSIANEKYQDCSYWYMIAEWNDIADPITLVTGATIKLPEYG